MATRLLSSLGRLLLAALLLAGVVSPAAMAAPIEGPTQRRAPEARAVAATADTGRAPGAYVPDEVIVRFRPGVSASSSAASHSRAGARLEKSLGLVDGLQLARVGRGVSVEAAIAAYEAMPEVLYAQPNYVVSVQGVPDDPYWAELWGLENSGQTVNGTPGTLDADIDASAAWDVIDAALPAPVEVVVGVIDTGVDYNHPDLQAHLWTNTAEAAGLPGVDDDGNGYVDDLHGWDAVANDGDPADEHGHGTHCAGTIAAESNNALGVAGVAPDAMIMPIRFLDENGSGTTSNAIEAFAYADAMGVRVLSNSWGGWYSFSQAEYDAIAAMSDTLFVFAAGNDNKDITSFWPGGTIGGIYYPANSGWYYYPASYDLDNILVVGATNQNDARASFSNYSSTRVDVFAPGVNTFSTVPGVVSIAPDATENEVLTDPFDDLSGWLTTAYTYNKWALRTDAYTSESAAAAHVGYVNNEMSFLDQAAPLDLSAADVPLVRFQVRYDLEPNGDFFYWGIYDPTQPEGEQFPILQTYTGSTSDAFREVVYDFGAYAGRNDIALWFGLWSNSANSSAQGYDGVWLDDVEVIDLDAGPSGSPWAIDYTNAYGFKSGTSMATPHVAGVAGLLLSLEPTLTVEQITTAIEGGVDVKAALAGYCVTSGRVNAHTTITAPIALPDGFDGSGASVAALGARLANVSIADVGVPVTVPAPGVLANDLDPNGDEITAEKFANPVHGSVVVGTDGSFTYTPDPGYFGADTFSYRAKDPSGTYSAPTEVTVEVVDFPPTAVDDGYATEFEATLSVDAAAGVLGNDSDPEAHGLTAALVDDATHGDLLLAADGSFQYVPDASWSGTDTFTYTADDGPNTSNVATVTVEVREPNSPPDAVDDAYETAEDVVLNVAVPGLLANDIDADGDELTIPSMNNGTYGAVSHAGDGSFSYGSLANWYGTDTFTYTVSDGRGGTDEATVTITVTPVNDTPVAVADAYETPEDTPLVVGTADSVLDNDSDVDHDPISAVKVSDPVHGTLVLSADGTFTYTPDPDWNGSDSFTYQATDGTADSNTVTVSINVTPVDDPEPLPPVIEIAGDDRFTTAVEASLEAYPEGLDLAGAKTVVIATGRNWPDALGGSALAGALDGPLLLTEPGSLPSAVATEIDRLGAEKAIILGGEAAVAPEVETALEGLLGAGTVERIAGDNRYETADAVALRTIALLGTGYDGTAFVATGGNFPDALGASPLAAANGWPLLLAHPTSGLSAGTVAAMADVDEVLILGGTGAVSTAVETYLVGTYGDPSVTRLAGDDRYETAADVAAYGVDEGGLGWNRVAIATGTNFPDALAGGVLQGKVGSVMLLTRPTALDPYTQAALSANKADITTVTFFGGTGALPQLVRDAVLAALE